MTVTPVMPTTTTSHHERTAFKPAADALQQTGGKDDD